MSGGQGVTAQGHKNTMHEKHRGRKVGGGDLHLEDRKVLFAALAHLNTVAMAHTSVPAPEVSLTIGEVVRPQPMAGIVRDYTPSSNSDDRRVNSARRSDAIPRPEVLLSSGSQDPSGEELPPPVIGDISTRVIDTATTDLRRDGDTRSHSPHQVNVGGSALVVRGTSPPPSPIVLGSAAADPSTLPSHSPA